MKAAQTLQKALKLLERAQWNSALEELRLTIHYAGRENDLITEIQARVALGEALLTPRSGEALLTPQSGVVPLGRQEVREAKIQLEQALKLAAGLEDQDLVRTEVNRAHELLGALPQT